MFYTYTQYSIYTQYIHTEININVSANSSVYHSFMAETFQIVFLSCKNNQDTAAFLLSFLETVLWTFVTSYKYIFFLFRLFYDTFEIGFYT